MGYTIVSLAGSQKPCQTMRRLPLICGIQSGFCQIFTSSPASRYTLIPVRVWHDRIWWITMQCFLHTHLYKCNRIPITLKHHKVFFLNFSDIWYRYPIYCIWIWPVYTFSRFKSLMVISTVQKQLQVQRFQRIFLGLNTPHHLAI